MTDDEDGLDPRVRRTHRDVVSAAGDLLLEGGWAAVTHAAVANRAGYSKATLYNHWPGAADLGRAAFLHACAAPEYTPTGDLRADLIGDLTAFAEALTDRQVGRILAALVERAPTDPSMAELLASFVRQGNARLLGLLADHGYDRVEAETMLDLLSGAVAYRVMLRQLDASPEVIERLVDRLLAASPPG